MFLAERGNNGAHQAGTKIERMEGRQAEMEDALKTLQGEIKDRGIKDIFAIYFGICLP